MTQPPDSQEKANSPSPERCFVQRRVVQPLIQWMPLGGSGWLFVSFLLRQEWAQVLLTFPVTVVTAIWAAYSKSFVEQLGEIYAEKGKQDADALVNWMSSLNETLKWQLSGFDDKYLRRQADDCESFRSEGLVQHDRIFTPLLEEVFVPLRLDANPLSPGLKQQVFEQVFGQYQDTTTIWDILSRTRQESIFRQIVILAWGGYGKTTLLKHIAYRYGKKRQPRSAPKLIPVLLVLRKYRDLLSQSNPPDLPELITNHHIPALPGERLSVPPTWAKDLLKQGNALIMLDGFDEVAKAQRPAVARWIDQQLRLYGKSVFIVTSRPRAYRDQEAGERLELATAFWVKDFDANQRQDFVQRWYLCQEQMQTQRDTEEVKKIAADAARDLLTQIEARQELKDLAKNPLLLNMIVTFHRRFPGAELPKRRVELYREICLLQLRDRPAARKLETLLTQCDAQTILQMLALELMRNRKECIERADLLRELAYYLQQQGETVAAADFLEQVVQISELLVEREPDEFEFAHLSFQEYLAATQIAQHQPEKVLYDYIYDDWWKPTILLYVAQVKNPTSLIRTIHQRGATDFAYTCLQETTKQVAPKLADELNALKQTVKSSRYAKLEDYLKNGQWEKADFETYCLMITAVGKEVSQWFEEEDLINFPCEDLRTIDQLWVNYSHGKWGFSVQKQIYVECGAKLDGNYPDRKIWEKFGDRVGWRKNEDWLDYDNFTFDLQKTPAGKFPVLGGILASAAFWFSFSPLAHRLVNCSIAES